MSISVNTSTKNRFNCYQKTIIGNSADIHDTTKMFGGRRHAKLKSRFWSIVDHNCIVSSKSMRLVKGTALVWSEVQNLSHEDESNMATLEELMCETWVCAQETEITTNIQDEGDEFFNSLDACF